MRAQKLVLTDNKTGREYVHSDSAFYFSHSITRILAELQTAHLAQIITDKIELDAYRDFLQPLGTDPIPITDYLLATRADPSLHSIFKSVYNSLTGCKSIVLALTDSEFFHLGTVPELLNLYLDKTSAEAQHFRHSVCFKRLKLSCEHSREMAFLKGCAFYSSIKGVCHQEETSLMEFCSIGKGVSIELERFTYVNNCSLRACELAGVWEINRPLRVLENTCFHTVSIRIDGRVMFVTVFFGRNDDLKKVYGSVGEIEFLGSRVLERVVQRRPGVCSVWGLRLFKACETMSRAFVEAAEFVREYLSGDVKGICERVANEETGVYCLFDLLEVQSHEEMVRFREENCLV